MVTEGYVPGRGDIVWMSFTPQAGHEQAGHRPALVVSPRNYNAATNLGLFCPITSQIKGYPFEVELPADGAVVGAVLADQIKSLETGPGPESNGSGISAGEVTVRVTG